MPIKTWTACLLIALLARPVSFGASPVFLAGGPSDLVSSWYPLQVGNSWTYEIESRDAGPDEAHGIENPTIGRWTMEETVTLVEALRGGTRVTMTRTLGPLTRINEWVDTRSLLTPRTRQLDVIGSCVEQIGSDLQYCFPMRAGTEWGAVSADSTRDATSWATKSRNGDLFGVPDAQTFHVHGYHGSGSTIDYWFQKGVGVVQFVELHHGTYDEFRQRLVSATIDGATRTFDLEPARTIPLDPSECRNGWRQWVTTEGSLLPTLKTCLAYEPVIRRH